MPLIMRQLLCLAVLCLGITAHLDQLLHYETLHTSAIHHSRNLAKRSLGRRQVTETTVDFEVLGRTFELHLLPRRGLFSRSFRAVSIGEYEEMEIEVDKEAFLEGYVGGEEGRSRVYAYFEGDNLVANIRTESETYVVEPSWRHLGKSAQHSMIAYKASDLMLNQTEDEEAHGPRSYCGYVRADGQDEAAYVPPNDMVPAVYDRQTAHTKPDSATSDSPSRKKRAASEPSSNTCNIMLVADYKFFNEVGGGDSSATIAYLVSEISTVDGWYRTSVFDDTYTGLGFEIGGIQVYEAPTAVAAGETDFNMESTSWATEALLTDFSHNDWGDYCLAHLWTATAFSDGVLGLGWIASSVVGAAGGICSGNSGGYYYNTAWSSALNRYGNRILTLEAALVTAHELGHNWGSQHDPSTTECSPETSSGGKYMMYTYSVSGYESNNEQFSPCSQRSIVAVLDNKLDGCFRTPSESFCGNLNVESSYEDCDAGQPGLMDEDPCCASDCTFKAGAVCSDANSECCSSCSYSAASVLCRMGSNITCDDNTYCSGTDADCPTSTPRPDGSSCIDEGQCESGVCLSFCEWNGALPCTCDEEDYTCLFCCKNATDGVCKPWGFYSGTNYTYLPDGRSCSQGYCDNGECITEILTGTARLWDIVNNIDLNAIIEFIKKNIVLTIILISLFIYVPICGIIACVDWKRSKKDEEERAWHHSENDELYSSTEKKYIRQTYIRKRPPPSDENHNAPIPRAGSGISSRHIEVSPL